METVAREVPRYDRPLSGSFGRGVRHGVSVALARFADLVATGGRPHDVGLEVYRSSGAAGRRP